MPVRPARAAAPLALLVLCLGALGAADDVPAPAMLYPAKGGEPTKAMVVKVTMKTVFMKLVGPDGAASADANRPYADYARIEYEKSDNIDYLKAKADYDRKEWDKAANGFAAAVKSLAWQPLREESLLLGARASLNAKKADAALATIQQLESGYPESIHLPAAVALRGDAAQAKGDAAGATAAYKKLMDSAGAWGAESSMLGIKGQASLARAGGKPADAAAIIAKALGTLVKPETPGYGELAIQLAEDSIAAGKKPEAIAAYEKAFFIPDAPQAAAHLGVAKLRFETAATVPELEAAFDQAALAALTPGADGRSADAGRKLAREIVAKMQELAKADAKLKDVVSEYQTYLGNL